MPDDTVDNIAYRVCFDERFLLFFPTGQCICTHNTAGSNCEHCARGFYGQPLRGTPDDCKPCPCPDNGPCVIRASNEFEPICTECPIGRTGIIKISIN